MKPLAAQTAHARREGKLVVSGQPGEEPRRSIAETFAGIAPPARRPAERIGASQLILAPFSAPTQFPGNVTTQLPLQHFLPAAALLVRKPNPGEMKQFVDQNALKFTPAREHACVEQDQTPGDGRARKMSPQGRANFHANRASQQGRQHNLFGGRSRRRCTGKRNRYLGLREKLHVLYRGIKTFAHFGEPLVQMSLAYFLTDGRG